MILMSHNIAISVPKSIQPSKKAFSLLKGGYKKQISKGGNTFTEKCKKKKKNDTSYAIHFLFFFCLFLPYPIISDCIFSRDNTSADG